jgi:hypothetical protein
MIRLEKNKDHSLPLEFINNLKSEDEEKKWAIMIFTKTSKVLRIIPTRVPSVIKVFVKYSRSEPNSIQEIGEVFMKNKITTVYSEGPCMCGVIPPHRGYEGYIESYKLSVPEDQLRSELLAMTNVINVEITKYQL